jgi:hypothetical protein
MVAALLVPHAAAATSVPFASDDFSEGLDPTRWSVIDPLADGAVTVVDDRLQIGVPGGARHNPGVPNDAPRVLQQVPDDDLDLVVKFDSVPSQAWQMQGVLVEESASRYVRLELHHNGTSLRAYGATIFDGAVTQRFDTQIPAPEGSAWLRMERAGATWTLRFSFDGQCWAEAGSFSQALAVTAAGVFAGNWGSPAAAAPAFTAHVDLVENQAAPLDQGPAEDPPPDPGPFESDDFSGGLDPSRWSVTDPLGDSSVAVTGGQLHVEVPAGRRHDPWVCNDAPRVTQRVEDGDLDIVVGFASVPSQGWQMQGLVVEESPTRYVRFDVHHNGSSLRAYGASIVDGSATERFNQAIAPPAVPLWLRVIREADDWTLRLSSDGEAWWDAGGFSQPLAAAHAGVFAGNWHSSASSAPAFTVVVDAVENADPPPIPLTVEVTAPGDGDVVFEDAWLEAVVSGDGPVDRVEFFADSALIGIADSEPYALTWDTTGVADGDRLVEARVFGQGGGESSHSVAVTVGNGLDAAERVQADFEQGVLGADDHARYGFWSIAGDERLPARYAADGVDDHSATGWGLAFAGNWEALAPATVEELMEYLTPREEPLEGLGATAATAFPDCDPGVALWVMTSTYRCRTQVAPFTIVYDLEQHDGDRGVPEDDLLDADLLLGPNGVPDYVDQIAYAATRSRDHFVDDLDYSDPGNVTIVVWGEGKGGFAPPPQFWGSGFYVANRHQTPQYLSAHELFHVVQYEYLGLAALRAPLGTWWWMEATAEWAAHQAEWRVSGWPGEAQGQYASALPRFLGRPTEPLYRFDSPRGGDARQYGAFVLAEYLDMVAGRDAIRGTWERLGGSPGSAIRDELQSHELDLAEELPRFARANYFLDYAIPPRLTTGDVDLWRQDWLGADPRTGPDTYWHVPRPARSHQAGLTSGEPDTGSLYVEPGGAAYLELRPPGSGQADLVLGATRADTHVRAVGVPSGCGLDTVVLPRGATAAQVDIDVPHACDLVTLVVTHTDPDSPFITDVDWDVTFTRTRGLISHGDVQLGVDLYGYLGIEGGPPSSGSESTVVGLRYVPTNAEGIGASRPFEGWGVYDVHSGTSGWANAGNYPNASGLTLYSPTFSSSRATSVVRAAGDRLQVVHDFKPAPATSNLFEVAVTITHVGSVLEGTGNPVDVRYRRVVNWSVEPTPFDEYVTLRTTSIWVPQELVFTSNDGYAHANSYDLESDRGATGFFTNYGPMDQGALFDWDFGTLSTGESVSFSLFYGAAGSEQDALDAIAAVGAHVYALGKPSGAGGSTQGIPNTFLFAYRSPEPPGGT